MENKTLIIGLVLFVAAIGITSQQVYSQTTIVKTDFYLVENNKSPISGNGAVATDSIKCNAGDMMVQSSHAISIRNQGDPVPEVYVLKALHKVNPQDVAREVDYQFRNMGTHYVDVRLTALCLDMQ